MEQLIFYSPLVLSIIAKTIYYSLTMPILLNIQKRDKAQGIETKIEPSMFQTAYYLNRPLWLNNKPWLPIDYFIQFGDVFFFIIYSIFVIINAYNNPKPLLSIIIAIVILYCFYRIISIIILNIVKLFVIKTQR